ncbi:hypothetical protein KBB96_16815 [Luteolibacter ambystomatis]|uniref:Uncharacterized protein n=1 Tax=Luteolibacter ambystomatis TaxID=2824561 RepID=A0A975G817_9BACT|nr:hypothetical protein [Luteolibacter ambystomatis]QUE50513.1 hypothetical protein KBB96_16815 [Luteolibacter ambystomatis]
MAIYNPALQVFLIPLWDHTITLREGMRRLLSIGNDQGEVPFLVKIMENPAFDLPPLSMFRGRVTLEQHDCVHLLLGRGTTLYDEAFTIGFTMGSSKEMSSAATRWFATVAGRWYPKPYRFPKSARRIFTDAVHLGAVSECKPLDRVDFRPLMDFSLCEVRHRLGIEEELLQAYYNVEAMRNPKITACRRLRHKE